MEVILFGGFIVGVWWVAGWISEPTRVIDNIPAKEEELLRKIARKYRD